MQTCVSFLIANLLVFTSLHFFWVEKFSATSGLLKISPFCFQLFITRKQNRLGCILLAQGANNFAAH